MNLEALNFPALRSSFPLILRLSTGFTTIPIDRLRFLVAQSRDIRSLIYLFKFIFFCLLFANFFIKQVNWNWSSN